MSSVLMTDAFIMLNRSARLVYRHIPRYISNKKKHTVFVNKTTGNTLKKLEKYLAGIANSNRIK